MLSFSNDPISLSKLKFKLIMQNPILNEYNYTPIKSDFIKDLLGIPLVFQPINNNDLPFIFSCFALSIDGKVSYIDNPSGLNIAKLNRLAEPAERLADHAYLMLARTVADAIIISKKGSISKNGNYNLSVGYPELIKIRNQFYKSKLLWAILPCRNLDGIDFKSNFFNDPTNHIIIFTWESQINHYDVPKLFTHYNLSQFPQTVNLAPNINSNIDTECTKHNKFIITIDTNFPDMFKKLHNLGLKFILNESPMFHHVLLEHQLLNEIWLAYSGVYIGGNAPSLGNNCHSFTSTNHPEFEILTLHHIDYHFLYSRQKAYYKTVA